MGILRAFLISPHCASDSPPLPSDEELWSKLQDIGYTAYGLKPWRDSSIVFFREVESLCILRKHAVIMRFLFEELKEAIQIKLQPVLSSFQSELLWEDNLLKSLNDTWSCHCMALSILGRMFVSFDRSYFIVNGKSTTRNVANELFKQYISQNNDFMNMLLQAILHKLVSFRLKKAINREQLRGTFSILQTLNLYFGVFYEKIMEKTIEFYQREAETHIHNEFDIQRFMMVIEDRLQLEMDLTKNITQNTRDHNLENIMLQKLLSDNVHRLLSPEAKSSLHQSIVNSRTSEIQRFYVLFTKVNQLDSLKQAFKNSVKLLLKNIILEYNNCMIEPTVTDRMKEKKFITDILTCYESVQQITLVCFDSSAKFQLVLRDAVGETLNSSLQLSSKCAQLLCRQFDYILRNGLKADCNAECFTNREEQTGEKIKSMISLFTCIQAKDIFESCYCKDLSKRLLFKRSFSLDLEKLVVQRFREECGVTFTSKFEGMFRELVSSTQTFFDFCRSPEAASLKEAGFDFEVQTLATLVWPVSEDPISNVSDLVYPSPIQTLYTEFETFYNNNHKGQHIRWKSSLGQAIIRGNFRLDEYHDFAVSTAQALILLSFNSAKQLCANDLAELLRFPDAKELNREMLSLHVTDGRRVLIRAQTEKKNAPKEAMLFKVNQEFKGGSLRIVIPQIHMKDLREEYDDVEQKSEVDRSHTIDAALVRIMKAKKTASHTDLLQLLREQISFITTPNIVKKRIEGLILKEFIERSDADPNVYLYVA